MSQVCILFHSSDDCHTVMLYIIVHCLLLKGSVLILISALSLNKSHMPVFCGEAMLIHVEKMTNSKAEWGTGGDKNNGSLVFLLQERLYL